MTYVLVTASTVGHAGYRSVLAAMLPMLCNTPEELASANAIRSILDGLAGLIGPLVAGGAARHGSSYLPCRLIGHPG